MSVTFPPNPTDGETVIYGSLRYTYFAEKQVWKTSKVLGIPTVTSVTSTTETLLANETTTVQITAFSGYVITNVAVDNAAWVRIYSSEQDMINDQYRMQTTDPGPDSGVASELITYEPGTYNVTPGIYVANSDSPVTNLMYIRVTNLGLSSAAITITVNIIEIGV